MASNLSSIGFQFAGEQSFLETMTQLADECVETLHCDVGDYAIWRSATGAEVWFHLAPQIGDEREVLGLTPFYEGQSSLPLRIEQASQRTDDNAFEGMLHAQVLNPQTGDALRPLAFAAVDFAAHATRDMPFACNARICGFARRLTSYPTAMTSNDATKHETLSGRILEHRKFSNEVAGHDFHWLLVESVAGTFDVVADPEIVDGEIVDGSWVDVDCQFFGRILSADQHED